MEDTEEIEEYDETQDLRPEADNMFSQSLSIEECNKQDLHNTETLISAWEGRICKFCLNK